MTSMGHLFYSPTSPFVRKVCVMATELGHKLTLEPIAASPVSPEPHPDLLAANPLGKVPALQLPSGRVLYGSQVICRYLGQGTPFYPDGDAHWDAVTREALADGLVDAALLARYENHLRPEALRWSDWAKGQMAKVNRALDAMEATRPDAARFDIGDVATGCALGYLDFRYPEIDWRGQYPHLQAFAGIIFARDSFRDTVPA